MNKNMKIAISKVRALLDAESIDETAAREAFAALESAMKMNESTPWWVIVLKTLAYLIGLLLAGYGTSAAAQTFLSF